MHLIVGFIQLAVALFLAWIYEFLPFDFLGRSIVWLSCAIYLAGAGLDEAAIDVLSRMGEDGTRLLRAKATRGGNQCIANHILELMDSTRSN